MVYRSTWVSSALSHSWAGEGVQGKGRLVSRALTIPAVKSVWHVWKWCLEAHSTHTTHSAHATSHSSGHFLLLLRQLCNHGLRRREQGCNTSSVQQSCPYHLQGEPERPLEHLQYLCMHSRGHHSFLFCLLWFRDYFSHHWTYKKHNNFVTQQLCNTPS